MPASNVVLGLRKRRLLLPQLTYLSLLLGSLFSTRTEWRSCPSIAALNKYGLRLLPRAEGKGTAPCFCGGLRRRHYRLTCGLRTRHVTFGHLCRAILSNANLRGDTALGAARGLFYILSWDCFAFPGILHCKPSTCRAAAVGTPAYASRLSNLRTLVLREE